MRAPGREEPMNNGIDEVALSGHFSITPRLKATDGMMLNLYLREAEKPDRVMPVAHRRLRHGGGPARASHDERVYRHVVVDYQPLARRARLRTRRSGPISRARGGRRGRHHL